MLSADAQFKKIYDETASVIADLGIRNVLSSEEMYFLLNLLETVVLNQDCRGLLDVLREWKPSQPESEIDQIIKATLLALDMTDLKALEENVAIVKGLIEEKA